jgi:hypothetical protein
MVMRTCVECGAEEALPRKQRGRECWERAQPVMVRLELADARLTLVPEPLRRTRVPESEWPPERRFCAGCQTFVLRRDCGPGASRCRTCLDRSSHAGRVQSLYGLSADEWNALMRKQGGRCAICRSRPTKYRLVVDHEHSTGLVRGLLCRRCNGELLSAAHHDVRILENAVRYMQTPPAQSQDWVQPEVLRGEPELPPF